MKLRLIVAAGALLLLTGSARAHVGGNPFVLINQQPVKGNPAGGLDPAIPLDLAPENYRPNQALKFAVDQNVLGTPGNQYQWEWAAGQTSDGLTVNHTFAKPGTSVVKLSMKGPDNKFRIIDTIGVNLTPSAGYKLPTAKVKVSPSSINRETFTVQVQANPSVDPTASVAKLEWKFFSTGQTVQGLSVKQTLPTTPIPYHPWIRVTDSKGFFSDLTFDMAVSKNKVVVQDNIFLPGVVGNGASHKAKLRLLGLTLTFLPIVGLIVFEISRRKRSSRKPKDAA